MDEGIELKLNLDWIINFPVIYEKEQKNKMNFFVLFAFINNSNENAIIFKMKAF